MNAMSGLGLFKQSPPPPSAFTLIELLVTLLIISIIGGLSLSGLASARQRSKIEKTKSTIRKINDIVVPYYENYAARRVTAVGSGQARARSRLVAIRRLMVEEMPDSWIDVSTSVCSTPPCRAIKARHNRLIDPAGPSPNRFNTIRNGKTDARETYGNLYANAETLYASVSGGAFSDGGLDVFRPDEVRDVDSDQAPEFVDAWNTPIMFIRWPAAFRSQLQSGDPVMQPDPLDPMLVSGVTPPPSQHDWLLIPLIYSAGPDAAGMDPLGDEDGYGILSSGAYPPSHPLITICYGNQQGTRSNVTAAVDNITNHDLTSK